jgi:hypothetical protein
LFIQNLNIQLHNYCLARNSGIPYRNSRIPILFICKVLKPPLVLNSENEIKI